MHIAKVSVENLKCLQSSALKSEVSLGILHKPLPPQLPLSLPRPLAEHQMEHHGLCPSEPCCVHMDNFEPNVNHQHSSIMIFKSFQGPRRGPAAAADRKNMASGLSFEPVVIAASVVRRMASLNLGYQQICEDHCFPTSACPGASLTCEGQPAPR